MCCGGVTFTMRTRLVMSFADIAKPTLKAGNGLDN